MSQSNPQQPQLHAHAAQDAVSYMTHHQYRGCNGSRANYNNKSHSHPVMMRNWQPSHKIAAAWLEMGAATATKSTPSCYTYSSKPYTDQVTKLCLVRRSCMPVSSRPQLSKAALKVLQTASVDDNPQLLQCAPWLPLSGGPFSAVPHRRPRLSHPRGFPGHSVTRDIPRNPTAHTYRTGCTSRTKVPFRTTTKNPSQRHNNTSSRHDRPTIVTAAHESSGTTATNPPGRSYPHTNTGREAPVEPASTMRDSSPSSPSSSSTADEDDQVDESGATADDASDCLWRTAVDPKSGRTYYYHIETRETQWRKPLELTTPEERRAAEEKERQQRDFFAAMEANILKTISQGAFGPGAESKNGNTLDENDGSHFPREIALPGSSSLLGADPHNSASGSLNSIGSLSQPRQQYHRPNLVRTISSMDDSVLISLIQRVPSHRNIFKSDSPQRGAASVQKEIVFQPVEAENSKNRRPMPPIKKEESSYGSSSSGFGIQRDASLSLIDATASLPRTAMNHSSSSRSISTRSTLFRDGSISLLEATSSSSQRLTLMESHMGISQRSTLGSINEREQTSATELVEGLALDGSFEESKDITYEVQDRKNSRRDLFKEGSFRMLLANLPKEGGDSVRSLYGCSAMDESNLDFALDNDEIEALEELAKVSDQIAMLEEDENGDMIPADMSGNRAMYLTDIDEDGMEEEDESEREDNTTVMPPLVQDIKTPSKPSFKAPQQYWEIPVAQEIGDLPGLSSKGGFQPPLPLVPEGHESMASQFEYPTPHVEHLSEQKPTAAPDNRAAARTRSSSHRKLNTGATEKPAMTRRNTCGTLYVGSTMSTPDEDATIKCVCGVYRAHILQSETEEEGEDAAQYRVFNDLESKQKATRKEYRPHVDFVVKPPPPTLEQITTFYRDVYRRAKMESDCIIMSLIYVERLIKITYGALRPRTSNWRSMLFSCMVLSSKVWDDLSMWNADFSQTCPAGIKFSLQRINELEIAVLSVLNYMVKVPASEYAKYYFLLRSMLIKSGLGSDELKTSNPLDVEGARKLQHLSTVYESTALSKANQNVAKATFLRSKSAGHVLSSGGKATSDIKVGLEHVVQM